MNLLSDEEIGGHDGMKKFVHTPEFKALNVGFALDEGMASPNEEFIIFNGERSIWRKTYSYKDHIKYIGDKLYNSSLYKDVSFYKMLMPTVKYLHFVIHKKA